MISDYYLVRHRRLVVQDLYRRDGMYEFWRGFNPRAIFALVAGVLIALVGLAVPALHWLYDYAWFVGFLISGGWYFLLMQRRASVSR
jgi:NCS1 family nucleobase:cation symporter-1